MLMNVFTTIFLLHSKIEKTTFLLKIYKQRITYQYNTASYRLSVITDINNKEVLES